MGNALELWDGDPASLREIAIVVMESVCGQFSELAAVRAAGFYDDLRAMYSVGDSFRAVPLPGRNPAATEGAVRAFISLVAKSGDVDGFVSRLVDRADYECRVAANECVARNAMRDPLKPRYARVPTGVETCGFCLMLASFGFNYRTAEAAGHAHKGCDCRVVPEFGPSSIRGYDPDAMYARFNECLDALGGRDGIYADWKAMDEEERRSYIDAHGGKAGEAYDAYVNKRLAAEIESRDATWFLGMKPRNLTR